MHGRRFPQQIHPTPLCAQHPARGAAQVPSPASVLGASTKDGRGEPQPAWVTHLRRAPDQPSLGDSPAAAITPLLLHNAFLRGQGWLSRLANAQLGPRGTEGNRGTCQQPEGASGACILPRLRPRVPTAMFAAPPEQVGLQHPALGVGGPCPKGTRWRSTEEAVTLLVPAFARVWDSLPLAEPRGCSTPIARDKARGSMPRAGTGSTPG